MLLLECPWLTIEQALDIILEGREEVYMSWMKAAEEDPIQTAKDFRDTVAKGRKTAKGLEVIRQADGILSGDPSFWQYGAKSQKEAIQFLISNTLMSSKFKMPAKIE
jgi:hypothetical protein